MAKGKIRIDVSSAGIQAILKSGEVQQFLKQKADEIAGRAGPGMEASVRIGKTRARASVVTATKAARIAEAEGRALTKAFGGTSMVAYTNKAGKTRMVSQAQADNWGARKK